MELIIIYPIAIIAVVIIAAIIIVTRYKGNIDVKMNIRKGELNIKKNHA